MRYLWMPRLVERIQAAAAATAAATATTTPGSPTLSATTTVTTTNNNSATYNYDHNLNNNNFEVHSGNMMLNTPAIMSNNFASNSHVTQGYATPENSSTGTAASSDSFGTQDYYSVPVGNNDNNPNPDYYQQGNQVSFMDCITSPPMLFPQELDFQAMELPNTPWVNQSTFNNFWNDENMLLLQHLSDNM